MLKLDFDAGNGGLMRELMVQVEILRLPALVGLRALNGGHEGVRNRRVIGELSGRNSVERDAETEFECFELKARRIGGGFAGACTGVA